MKKETYQPGDQVVFACDSENLPFGVYPPAGTVGRVETVDGDGNLWIRWPNGTRSCCSPFRVRKVETFAPGDKVLFRPVFDLDDIWARDVPTTALTVARVRGDSVFLRESPFLFHPSWLVRASAETKPNKLPKIILMQDKKDPRRVVAKDLDTGTIAAARCHPRDDFDFHTGAALAFSRLLRALGTDPFVLSVDTCGTNPDKPDSLTPSAKPHPERRPCTKFKVGDIVVGNERANVYGITKEGWHGKVVKILDHPQFYTAGPDAGFFQDIIVKGEGIFRDCEINFTVNSDRFDLAPQLYNGRIVCIYTPFPGLFTVGKIYTVKDGKLFYDDGRSAGANYRSFDDVKNFNSSRFIEITGEA